MSPDEYLDRRDQIRIVNRPIGAGVGTGDPALERLRQSDPARSPDNQPYRASQVAQDVARRLEARQMGGTPIVAPDGAEDAYERLAGIIADRIWKVAGPK